METYYLNKTWKFMLIASAVIGVFVMMILALLLIILQVINFLVVGLFILALLSMFESTYEALYIKIEFSETEVIYYQPRFILQFSWKDLEKIEIGIYGVVLIFSEAKILNGHWLVKVLKIFGPWERTIPYGCYISPTNIDKIEEIISTYKSNLDTDSIKLLSNHFKKA